MVSTGSKGETFTGHWQAFKANWTVAGEEEMFKAIFSPTAQRRLVTRTLNTPDELRDKAQNKKAKKRPVITDVQLDALRIDYAEPALKRRNRTLISTNEKFILMTYNAVELGRELGTRGCNICVAKNGDENRILEWRDITFSVGVGHFQVSGTYSSTVSLNADELYSMLDGDWEYMESQLTRVMDAHIRIVTTKTRQSVEDAFVGRRTTRERQVLGDIVRWLYVANPLLSDMVFRFKDEDGEERPVMTRNLSTAIKRSAYLVPQLREHMSKYNVHSMRVTIATRGIQNKSKLFKNGKFSKIGKFLKISIIFLK